MGDFYQDMQNVAKGLFKSFNQGEIAYVELTPGTGPADNPGAATETTTVLAGATARGVEFRFVKGSNVLATDLQINFAGGIVDPEPSGFFTIDGVRYKSVEIHRIPAAGTVVAYAVIVRK